ncbi:MAG: ABC transporter substrate-binding protein [Defluviitaleaceae bacterium]|nr:ABC transporter substrate-binding protein [Defluviitaleaceae bacterium]MCL2275326.1 ABC transporter substrate-binding protein [Defluviitaleaceae bacterium]
MTGAHQDGIDEIIAAFHAQNPYVRVTNIFQGNYGALRNQIMLNDLAGNLPHLGQATVSDTTLYMVDGMILPLNQFMDDPVVGVSQEHMDDIIRGFRATSVFDGVWYSIPFSKSVRVLYYNREMFNAAGLNPPTTWEELFNAAEILTEANPGITGFHFEGGSFDMEWVAMLFQQGGTYIDEASNRAVFASPQGASAMEFIINLVNSPFGGFPPAGTFNSGIFGQADIAMYIGSSAGLPHVTNAVAGTFDWGTAPIPGGAVEFAGNDLIMFENTSHSIEERVAAWELMRFTTEAETSARWAMASGYVPVTYTAAASQLFQDFLRDNPRAAAATASLDDGFFRTRNLQGGQVRTYLLEQFEEIRFGNISIEDGLERAQANANAALERGR